MSETLGAPEQTDVPGERGRGEPSASSWLWMSGARATVEEGLETQPPELSDDETRGPKSIPTSKTDLQAGEQGSKVPAS